MSKQKKESDTSFQIETTVMDAADEPQNQAQKTTSTTSPVKPAAISKKKEEKKKEKKEVSHEFVIETTVATPQFMKSLIGDNSQIVPDFEEAKEEPAVELKPQFAPKTAGLQGAKT